MAITKINGEQQIKEESIVNSLIKNGTLTLNKFAVPVATEEYVQEQLQNQISAFEWVNSVIDFGNSTPPTTPNTGDRYLLPAEGPEGDWEGHQDEIAEWNGTEWVFTQPKTGMAVIMDSTPKGFYVYNGTEWKFNETFSITGGSGINIWENSPGEKVIAFNNDEPLAITMGNKIGIRQYGITLDKIDPNIFGEGIIITSNKITISRARDMFISQQDDTTFQLTLRPVSSFDGIEVFLNGILQDGTSNGDYQYNNTNNSIVFFNPLNAGDKVQVIYFCL